MLGRVERVAQFRAPYFCSIFLYSASSNAGGVTTATFSASPCHAVRGWRRRSCEFPRAEFQRVGDGIFGNFQRARFHHDDGLSEPATMMFSRLVFCSATVGFTTSLPSSNPTRTRRSEW
jgi:hypothetical protein